MTEKLQNSKAVTEQKVDKSEKEEVKTLTIRLPEGLHKAFKEYAKAAKLPMNTLVVNYIKEAVKK